MRNNIFRTTLLVLAVVLSQATVAWGAATPLGAAAPWVPSAIPSVSENIPAQGAIIINHNHLDLSQIPNFWIDKAKEITFHYAHTSHGSQIISGLGAVYEEDNRFDFYRMSASSSDPPSSLPGVCGTGRLCLYDGQPAYNGSPYETYITPDLYWESEGGRNQTRVIGDSSIYDYSMWSWCGQMSEYDQPKVQDYLNVLTSFESAFPNMRFILMTGHSDGGSDELKANNGLARQYAQNNHMVLFDFEDIESYDPDGNYYNNNGEGYCEWCADWCTNHPEDCQHLPSSCAHSHPLACKMKAQAFWWMLARLAGWPGPSTGPDLAASSKTADKSSASTGDQITYTINVHSTQSASISLSDTIPTGLSYVFGSLIASSGNADDSQAPILSWSGTVDANQQATITYSVMVEATSTQRLTNTVQISPSSGTTVSRSASIMANGYICYLPVISR